MAEVKEEKESTREVGQYILGETLGKGGYSWVKLGIDKNDNAKVALKFMIRADASWEQEQANQVRTEIKSMIKIKSNHVMKLFAYNLNAKYPEKDGNVLNCILMVLEFCPGGELFDILYYCQQLNAITSRTYFRQLIQGLEDCHKAGVIHRDIKPQNLLLDQKFQLKITDFGLSKILKPENRDDMMRTTYVGTRGFQAPELLKKEKYTRACDVFSAGVVLFILLTGYPPFNHAKRDDQWYSPLAKGDSKKFWKQHKGCGVPAECKDLLEAMLCYKPAKRASIEDIKEHPWFKGEVLSKSELKAQLTKKHKAARAKRKKDPRKVEDLRASVKKRDIIDDQYKKIAEGWGPPPKIEENPFLNTWNVPTVLENGDKVDPVVPLQNITFFFKYTKPWMGKATVEPLDPEEPWCSKISLKDDKANPYELHINVFRTEKEYMYQFRKVQGQTFKWHKLWGEIENKLYDHEVFDNPNTPLITIDAVAEEVKA